MNCDYDFKQKNPDKTMNCLMDVHLIHKWMSIISRQDSKSEMTWGVIMVFYNEPLWQIAVSQL